VDCLPDYGVERTIACDEMNVALGSIGTRLLRITGDVLNFPGDRRKQVSFRRRWDLGDLELGDLLSLIGSRGDYFFLAF